MVGDTVRVIAQEMTADGDAAWPGGIRQQFLAARPMVEAILRRLKREPTLEVRLGSAIRLSHSHCGSAKPSYNN